MELKNKKENKLEKINPETNLKNFVPRFYRSIESRICFKNISFLDTNFLIKIDNDKRYKIFQNPLKKFYITNIVSSEIRNKNLNKKINKISFEELRTDVPDVCPLYFNFISGMHNPANICSPSFLTNFFWALKEKNKFTPNHDKMYNEVLKKINSNKTKLNVFGEEKSSWEKYLDKSFLEQYKKKNRIITKSKDNFFNDYKNLSLILIYSLIYKSNVTFYTADIDVFNNLFTWVDSMAHQLSFKNIILDQIGEDGKKRMMNDEKLVVFVNFDDFKTKCNGMLSDLLSNDWKKKRFSIEIKFWDMEKQKFNNDCKISFNEQTREILLTNHGLYYCPFCSNNSYGNFIRYNYHWPPTSEHDFNTIKISVMKKSIVKFRHTHVPAHIHGKYCKFINQENSDDLNLFAQSINVAG